MSSDWLTFNHKNVSLSRNKMFWDVTSLLICLALRLSSYGWILWIKWIISNCLNSLPADGIIMNNVWKHVFSSWMILYFIFYWPVRKKKKRFIITYVYDEKMQFENWKLLIEFPGNKVMTIEKNVTKPWLVCNAVFNAFKNFCLKINFTEIT